MRAFPPTSGKSRIVRAWLIVLLNGIVFSLVILSPLAVAGQQQRATVKSKPVIPRQPDILRSVFGQASHVVEAFIVNAVVYNRRGDQITPLPDTLHRRQYLELTLHLNKILCSNTAVLPDEITVRLEETGLLVPTFAQTLPSCHYIFLLKRSYRLPSDEFYYPADLHKPITILADTSKLTAWVKQRIKDTPAVPPGSKAYYRVPGKTFRVIQDGTADCWAAAAAMMLSWRDQRLYTRQEAAKLAGNEFALLLKNKGIEGGISSDSKLDFLNRLSLVAEAPQTFSAVGLRELLLEHGPFWVTTTTGQNVDPDFFLPHARIVISIDGDGSPETTVLTFLDPSIDTNLMRQNLKEFTEYYEKIAFEDVEISKKINPNTSQPFRPQILHF